MSEFIGGAGASSGGGAVTIADGADVAEGSKADVAWVSGDGTVISLLKKIASAGGSAVSIADGSDSAEGTTTDAAVITDAAGTVSGKLRGLVKMFADMWDSGNHRLNVSVQNTPAVTVTGSVTANAGTNLNTSLLALEAGGNLATCATDLTTLLGLILAQGAIATSVTGPLVMAKVADARESYADNTLEPFSMTTDGLLRVAASPSNSMLEFFRDDAPLSFNVPDLTNGSDLWAIGDNAPWP